MSQCRAECSDTAIPWLSISWGFDQTMPAWVPGSVPRFSQYLHPSWDLSVVCHSPAVCEAEACVRSFAIRSRAQFLISSSNAACLCLYCVFSFSLCPACRLYTQPVSLMPETWRPSSPPRPSSPVSSRLSLLQHRRTFLSCQPS